MHNINTQIIHFDDKYVISRRILRRAASRNNTCFLIGVIISNIPYHTAYIHIHWDLISTALARRVYRLREYISQPCVAIDFISDLIYPIKCDADQNSFKSPCMHGYFQSADQHPLRMGIHLTSILRGWGYTWPASPEDGDKPVSSY